MTYRFFINSKEINWNEKSAVISNQEHNYKIQKVLRLKESDQIVLLDGNGIIYNAQITSYNPKVTKCSLLSRRSANTEPALKITIAQALLKGPKLDYALQKNTEIGVYSFVLVTTDRTVIKFDEEGVSREIDRKLERYQKIVQDASEQSERGIVPKVENLLTLQELCKSNLGDYHLKLICLERSQTANGIKEILNSIQEKVQKVLILIGPEGGFTENEAKLATHSGFTPVTLGKRIYRSETVGTVASSVLFFYFNELQ